MKLPILRRHSCYALWGCETLWYAGQLFRAPDESLVFRQSDVQLCLVILFSRQIIWREEWDLHLQWTAVSEPVIALQFSSVQSLSHVWLSETPWIAARQASLSITNSQSPLKLMPIELVMPSSHLILCCPLLLPPIPPSIRVFSSESTLHMRWPKYWSFSFSISPSSEYPGLISFRMDWLDLLAVQGTLKSLLEHHSSKASIFQGHFKQGLKDSSC